MVNDQSAQPCGCDQGAAHACAQHSRRHPVTQGEGGWIGVDLDGTLVEYPHSFPAIGPEIPQMVARVKAWLAEGRDVRIFTARVALIPGLRSAHGEADEDFAADQQERIRLWSAWTFGCVLPATALKDFQMVELWDDRCIQLITNSGESLDERLSEIIRSRENQILSLCGILGVDAEEDLEACIRTLQADYKALLQHGADAG